jgi:hypothetical protein
VPDLATRRSVYGARGQLRSAVRKGALALRPEKVERTFELTLDRGGRLRGTDLHGPENVQERYLIHLAGYDLALAMRQQIGADTPKELAASRASLLWPLDPDLRPLLKRILPPDAGPALTSSMGR